ncbi:unnamed protein product [Boreogadus saida]
MRPPPPPLSSIHTESVFDRADDFSVAGFQELDVSSPDETALEELDASMSSQDLTADVDADAYNDIQNATIDWEDDTWFPDKDTESVSSLEEDNNNNNTFNLR